MLNTVLQEDILQTWNESFQKLEHLLQQIEDMKHPISGKLKLVIEEAHTLLMS